MAQISTRLGVLMDMLGITGKELAVEIDTDTTTVSKWRSGQRKLRARSIYCKRICRYFLSDSFLLHRHRLLELLDNSHFDLDTLQGEEIEDALGAWLTEELSKQEKEYSDIGNNHQEITVKQYYGYRGWKQAMNDFWAELKLLPPGQKVYIGDFGDIKWDLVEPDYIHTMLDRISDAVYAGHKVVIIDSMTDEYRPYVVLLRWLPVYLSENVDVRYIQRNMDELYQESIYLVENHCVLLGLNASEDNEGILNRMHRDVRNIDFFRDIMNLIENKSRKLIYNTSLHDPLLMVRIMKENFKPHQLTYMINQVPTFRNMPLELLEDILQDNQVEEALVSLCVEANKKRREIRNSSNYIQIYNLDELERIVHEESFIDYDLSRIIGRNIRIKKKYLKKYLQYLAGITYTDTYTLVLTSFKELNLNVDHSSITVQDDSIVIAWNAELYDRAIYCKELTVVGGYFQYLKNIWNRIPLISKNNVWTQKQFMKLLEY